MDASSIKFRFTVRAFAADHGVMETPLQLRQEDAASGSADIMAWRKARRAEMIAARLAMPEDERRRDDQRITGHLLAAFPMLESLILSFYWPFNGEVDARVAVHRLRTLGAITALPVVVAKRAPLEFREWSPGTATLPGVFGLPVPQSRRVVPQALLIPPVGFDAHGYRLGYGGGYFDRTLAALPPTTLKIALARAVSRMQTIYPQSHDIPMDFVITEEGVHEATAAGLEAVDPRAVANRAAYWQEKGAR